jgi:hypothetical protein
MHFVKSLKKAFIITEVEDDPDKEIYKRESIHLSDRTQAAVHCLRIPG